MPRTTLPPESTTASAWHIPPPLGLQLGLIVCVVAVFYPLFGADFLNYDDNVNIYKNSRITDFSLSSLILFWQEPYEKLYIPLTYTVWGVLAKLSSLIPAGNGSTTLHPSLFHATNLLLHAGSVLALLQILRLLLKDGWAAAAGVLLFAIHPVQVEAVAWVTGLKDSLCGFFSMLALWQYLAYAATTTQGPPWQHKRYAVATLFLAAALLAKPGAVTLPLTAALLGPLLSSPRSARQLALELVPWVLLAVPVVLITKLSQPAEQHAYLPGLWQRFLIAGDAITFYLGKLLLPLTLGPDYGRTPQSVLDHGWIYATGLLPYLLALLLLGWQGRRPWLLAAAGAFLAPLLPVLGFIPFDFQEFSTVADRYLYMAMLGPALGLGWLVSRYREGRALRMSIIAILFLLAIKSAVQVRLWLDPLTFNTHMVTVNPQSAAGYTNLGINLKEANRLDEAIASFQKAIRIAPKSPNAFHSYINLGQIYENRSMPEEAQGYYKKATEIVPWAADIYSDNNSDLGDRARASGDLELALKHYQLAIEARPDSAKDLANLGLTYKDLNKTAEAIAAYQKAIAIAPDFAEVYNNLGLLFEAEDKEKAISMYQKALASKPGLGEAANNLGFLYLGMKRELEAIPLFKQAIAAYPDQPLPCNNLGLTYVNLGQLAEAAVWFQKALSVDQTFAPALINLSKVELQQGDIQSARDHADKAKALGLDDPEHFKALQEYRK